MSLLNSRLLLPILLSYIVWATFLLGEVRNEEMGTNCNVEAICQMRNNTINGDITLEQTEANCAVTVSGHICGLTPGKHGFHVHAIGDLSDGCKSAGAHYNPDNKDHGAPGDEHRHIGDLGNVDAKENGIADIMITDSQIQLCGEKSVLGRTMVVHANEDDLGKGGNAESLKTGNAGARIACCIITASDK